MLPKPDHKWRYLQGYQSGVEFVGSMRAGCYSDEYIQAKSRDKSEELLAATKNALRNGQFDQAYFFRGYVDAIKTFADFKLPAILSPDGD